MAIRTHLTLFVVLVATAALAPAGGAGSLADALPTLHVAYALNCTFTISDDSGRLLTSASSITPGNYQVEVTTPVAFATVDLTGSSDFMACKGSVQFQLTGPGVGLYTTLADGRSAREVLEATFAIAATYTLQDNRQPLVARGQFATMSDSPPSTPGPIILPCGYSGCGSRACPHNAKCTAQLDLVGPSKGPLRGTLAATLSATGKLSLMTRGGKTVVTLKAGRYKFAIDDRSSDRGVVLQRIDRRAKSLSGRKFLGKTWKGVNLAAGRWAYSSGAGSVHYFLVLP